LTVLQYIEEFKRANDVPYDNAMLLRHINDVEQNVYADVIEDFRNERYPAEPGADRFDPPTDDMTRIVTVMVSGRKYQKVDARADKQPYSYWLEDDMINVFPPCGHYISDRYGEVADHLVYGHRFGHEHRPTDTRPWDKDGADKDRYYTQHYHVFDSHSYFRRGEVIITYRHVPKPHQMEYAGHEELVIPDRFGRLYDYYLLAQVAYLQKDYNEYANHQAMYNQAVSEFVAWWENVRPTKPVKLMQATEAW